MSQTNCYNDRFKDLTILLALLTLIQFSHSVESDNDYMRSRLHDDSIYSRDSSEPYKLQRRNDFFLKAGKSVPRIGRRNSELLNDSSYKLTPDVSDNYEKTSSENGVHRVSRRNDFFFKAHKTVHKTIPRIGRRNEVVDFSENGVSTDDGENDAAAKVNKKDDSINSMDKGEALAAWPWFRNPEFYSRYQRKYKEPLSDHNSWSDDSYTLGEYKNENELTPKQCENLKFRGSYSGHLYSPSKNPEIINNL